MKPKQILLNYERLNVDKLNGISFNWTSENN